MESIYMFFIDIALDFLLHIMDNILEIFLMFMFWSWEDIQKLLSFDMSFTQRISLSNSKYRPVKNIVWL